MFAVENELQIQHYEIQRSVNGRDFNRIADMSPGKTRVGLPNICMRITESTERYLLYRVKAIQS